MTVDTVLPEGTRTRAGERVNRYSNLCGFCSRTVAQSAAHFALDDSELTDKQRLRLIVQMIRRDVASCVKRCGRVEDQ